MIKRIRNLTSLLIAASSVISLTPASASTRLGVKDGTINNAVAYKDGVYLYQGYKSEDDEDSLYYNSDSKKDKELSDADTMGEKFDDKYVSAFDGSDEYKVDLSTGKITDDNTLSDLKDTAKTKLTNKLKKTDRYEESVSVEYFERIPNNSFDDNWYLYTATTSGSASAPDKLSISYSATSNAVTTSSAAIQPYYYGFTNESGKYVDCSHEENLYVYNGYKMVKLEKVGDTEKASQSDKDKGARDLTLNSIEPMETLGQDNKYLYLLSRADITGAKKLKPEGSDYSDRSYLYFIQKISKTQGDKEKDAYLPKDITSFEISEYMGDSDVKNALNDIIGHYKDDNARIQIVDGVIYVVYTEDDKVNIKKVLLKTSYKLNKYSNGSKESSKIDGHVAKEEEDTDTDISKDDGTKSWSIDVNGNVWAIDNGKIKKSSKCGDFDTIYTCDRSLDCIDVYDKDNLIAWDESGDVYTTITEGIRQSKQDAIDIVGEPKPVEKKTGWVQLDNGAWTLYDANGNLTVSKWSNVAGTWYYFDSQGVMQTDWVYWNGSWYYLNPKSDGTKGAMETGWIYWNNSWYYLNSSGAMQTGWVQSNGYWYYLNTDGSMAHDTVIDGYTLASSGEWVY